MQHVHSQELRAMPTRMSIAMRNVALAACLSAVSALADSQPASSPSEQSEPHELLAFLEGTWTLVGENPDNFRETCDWLTGGRRHVVCTSRWQDATGPLEALGIYSYDQPTGEYVWHGFGASGTVVKEKVQRLPNGWLYTSERGTGNERVRTREMLEEMAEGRFTAIKETAKSDGPWIFERKIEYQRTRP